MEQHEQSPQAIEVAIQVNEHDIANILGEYLQQQLTDVALESDEPLYSDALGNSYRENGELISSDPRTAILINALNIFRQGMPQIGPWHSHLTEGARPTIMIVDDEASVSAFIRSALESTLEVNIIETADGSEALALCDNAAPDLVILDMVMPNKDGFETGRELARMGIPFIAATSLEDSESILRISQIGSLSFLAKPARRSQVLGVVASALAQIQQINAAKHHKCSVCDICTARGAISAMLTIPPDQAFEVLKEMGRDNHGNTRNTAATVNGFLEFMAKANKKYEARQRRLHNKITKPRS